MRFINVREKGICNIHADLNKLSKRDTLTVIFVGIVNFLNVLKQIITRNLHFFFSIRIKMFNENNFSFQITSFLLALLLS